MVINVSDLQRGGVYCTDMEREGWVRRG